MKKKAVLLFLLMMIVAGCAKAPEQEVIEEVKQEESAGEEESMQQSGTQDEKTQQNQTGDTKADQQDSETQKNAEQAGAGTEASEQKPEEEQKTDADGQESDAEDMDVKQQTLVLTEDKRRIIEDCLTNGIFQYEPILVEEMTAYLHERGILFEGYYDTNVRINITLEDGTSLVFLRTQNSDMEDTGYQLMLKDASFNASGFQENYTNAYDVNTDQYYEPNLSERIWMEDEIAGMSKLDFAIARNQVFARYGRRFDDPLLQNIFAVKSWYEPKYSPEEFDLMSQEFLTEIERENLKMIMQYEKLWGYRKTAESGVKEAKGFVSGSWIDLDGDGKKEQVIYQPGERKESGGFIYLWEVTVIVGDASVTYEGPTVDTIGYLVSMDDTHSYIVVADFGQSADYVSTFYEYKDGELKQVGQMYAHPDSLIVYEDKILAPEETYHFQCQPVKFRYELIDGMFVKQEDEYYEYRGNIATAQQEVQLYSSKEGTEIGVTVAEGEDIQVMGGDMKEWVLLKKVSTGEEGWIRTEGFHDCILPNGETIYSGALFEELYFYG